MDKTGRKRGRGADPDETKRQLVDAAFAALREDGFATTTARSIAQRAECNQAAIYYHFGGIEPLLLAALDASNLRRLDRYRAALGDITDIAGLIAEIQELYRADAASGHLRVLTELVGGIAASPTLGAGIDAATGAWLDFVEERIRAATAQLPIGSLVPVEDVADLIFSVVLGIEIRNRIDGRSDRADRLFALAGLVAGLVDVTPPKT